MVRGVVKKIHTGEGYHPLVDFESWRVAILKKDEKTVLRTMPFFERHLYTDEVFVLLQGICLLLWAEDVSVTKLHGEILKSNTVYNVKKNTWHAVALTDSTQVLIVENQNTTYQNSDIEQIDCLQRKKILEIAQRLGYPKI